MRKPRNTLKRLIVAAVVCTALFQVCQKLWNGGSEQPRDENLLNPFFINNSDHQVHDLEKIPVVEDEERKVVEHVQEEVAKPEIPELEKEVDNDPESRIHLKTGNAAEHEEANNLQLDKAKRLEEEREIEDEDLVKDLGNEDGHKHEQAVVHSAKPTTSKADKFEIDDTNVIFAQKIFENNFKKLDQMKDEGSKDSYTKKRQKESTHFKIDKLGNRGNPKTIDAENRSIHHQDGDPFAGPSPTFPTYDLPLRKANPKPVNLTLEQTVIAGSDIFNETANDSEAMEGVFILGEIDPKKKYATFSTTTENRESLNYIFYLPLTTLAWKRIGYDSVIIVVGSKDDWNTEPLYNHVLSSARELDAVFVFLEPRPDKSVMISQVSRIFVANILRSAFKNIDDVYLITSDADLWPIYNEAYSLPIGKDILSLNSDCCSPFSHRGKSYRMLPMANIGMKIGIWRKITQKFSNSPHSIDDILTFLVREFGNIALRAVHKGDNVGWFLDQMLISVLIAQWTEDHSGQNRVKYIPRNVGMDRIDRAGWNHGSEIDDKIDAHLLEDGYVPGVWVRLTHLLRAMYGDGSDRFSWCLDYYEKFQTQFMNKYRNSRL